MKWVIALTLALFLGFAPRASAHEGKTVDINGLFCIDPAYVEAHMHMVRQGAEFDEALERINTLARTLVCVHDRAVVEITKRMGDHTYSVGGQTWSIFEAKIVAIVVNGKLVPPPELPPFYVALATEDRSS